MKLRELFEREDAVSPVIGVILMVAITVILAAVIASFVLGLGDETQGTTPTVSIDCDTSTDEMTHDGGDEIDVSNIEIGGSSAGSSTSATYSAGDDINADIGASLSDGTPLTWQDPESDSSTVLAEC